MGSYRAFAVTAIGKSHEKVGKECQDFSKYLPKPPSKDPKTAVTVAVADGHGDDNCFRSGKGAEFACMCAIDGLRELAKKSERLQDEDIELAIEKDDDKAKEAKERIAQRLISHIIRDWRERVTEDYSKDKGDKNSNFSENELAQASEKYRKRYENGESLSKAYGTTLIAAMVTERYWLGIHIGDGRFSVLYPDGKFDQPVLWDDRCFLNVVTSICDDDSAERARFCFFSNDKKEPPTAVFLCSDGVDDNYPVEENEIHLYKLYETIAHTFVKDGFDETCKQLKDLAVKFATKGKGDDTTIAGFVDMDRLEKVVRKWNEQKDKTIDAERYVNAEAIVLDETADDKKINVGTDKKI